MELMAPREDAMKKILFAAVFTVSLVTAFAAINETQKEKAVKTPFEVLEEISTMLQKNSGLGLKLTDCKPLYLSDVAKDTKCFLSHVDPYVLAQSLRIPLDKIAFTSGWLDQEVSGAFYALISHPEQTFSIGVKPIQGSRQLKDAKSIQSFSSFVSLSVNTTPGHY